MSPVLSRYCLMFSPNGWPGNWNIYIVVMVQTRIYKMTF
jgi:hypothetical protein